MNQNDKRLFSIDHGNGPAPQAKVSYMQEGTGSKAQREAQNRQMQVLRLDYTAFKELKVVLIYAFQSYCMMLCFMKSIQRVCHIIKEIGTEITLRESQLFSLVKHRVHGKLFPCVLVWQAVSSVPCSKKDDASFVSSATDTRACLLYPMS